MFSREDYQKLEEKNLAPYAMKSKNSQGRLYEEPLHRVRTCYQRDRDRIVHSQAFRKLEYKTQVFVIFEGDYYRTRLTHTIEVAQIARTIGRALRLNEDLIEAIALAHDLGHPPFGHAGEDALDRIMKDHAGETFNHNFRSYEIVTNFERRYPDFHGLNLSEEVVVGILKHETGFDKKGNVERYRSIGPTLEAHVVDVADSLAYLSHDVDDGLTSGCITENDLVDSVLWSSAYKKIKAALETRDQDVIKYQIVKFLIDAQIKDLLVSSVKNIDEKKFKSSDEVKDYNLKHPNKKLIGYSKDMEKQRNELQQLLQDKLYNHYRVVRMTEKAKRVINEIFKVYSDNPNQLPYFIWERGKRYSKKRKCQKICNYIAGMTDRFALDEHKKLFNPYQKV